MNNVLGKCIFLPIDVIILKITRMNILPLMRILF